MGNLANAYLSQGDYAKAIDYHQLQRWKLPNGEGQELL
ncbi:MAG: tetratricopeptide repeat protein [Cyanobacteriota bacterium]